MPASAKNLHSYLIFAFFILLFAVFGTPQIYGQGASCAQAVEFCPSEDSDDVTFPAGVNNGNAEPGNNYGCLNTFPNPAWYYIQIGQPGTLTIQLTNSNNEDVDFAMWGPFPDLNVALGECGDLDSPTDCSYSPSANETVVFPFSQPGEIYILLITNFSNDPTNIFGEAFGDGVPACCTTPINTGMTCPEPSFFSCGCWLDGITGVLPVDNAGTPPTDFCGSTENQQWISFESCWCGVQIEVSAEDCPDAAGVEAQLFSDCAPFEPASQCIEIADGTSAFLPALTGGNDISCEMNETYTLLLDGIDGDVCSYTVTLTEVPVSPPIFAEDTIIGPTSVCHYDTVTYFFPEVFGATFCDATFTAADAEVLNVTHESFTVIFGETSGTLCIFASNCAGQVQICLETDVLPCCFSEPGTLVANDYVICEGEAVTVTHAVPFFIDEGDAGQFILHDGIGIPLGNIIETNTTGQFTFEPPLLPEQTYFIDYAVSSLDDNGDFDYDDQFCFQLAGGQNTVSFFADNPQLSTTAPVITCDDLAAFYTVQFEIANGTPPYFINGTEIAGNIYLSEPIPAGEAYFFEVTSENFCLDSVTVSGQEICPCETFAGMIEDEFTELCGDDEVQILPTETPVLDDNDVFVYVLRNAAGEVIVENTTGNFSIQPGINTNEIYYICGYAGNDDGTGSPLTDYACFSSTDCKEVVFYDAIEVTLPDTTEITCNLPMPQIVSLITGGSGEYILEWSKDGTVLSAENSITVEEEGIYTLTVSDMNTSCTATAEAFAEVASVITGLEIETIDPTCFGDADGMILIREVIGGVPPFRYRLNEEPLTGNTEFILLPAEDYTVTVADSNGCEFAADAKLNQPPQVTVDLGPDQEVSLGDEVNLEAVTNIDSAFIAWTINEVLQPDTLFTIDSVFLQSIFAIATVKDRNGCFASDTIRVNVEQSDPIYLPNVFSPNFDGINDELNVYGDKSVATIDFLRIYNRWGSLLYAQEIPFAPNDTSVGWNGMHRGKVVGNDVYVYIMQVTYIDGRTESFTGDVTVLK